MTCPFSNFWVGEVAAIASTRSQRIQSCRSEKWTEWTLKLHNARDTLFENTCACRKVWEIIEIVASPRLISFTFAHCPTGRSHLQLLAKLFDGNESQLVASAGLSFYVFFNLRITTCRGLRAGWGLPPWIKLSSESKDLAHWICLKLKASENPENVTWLEIWKSAHLQETCSQACHCFAETCCWFQETDKVVIYWIHVQ